METAFISSQKGPRNSGLTLLRKLNVKYTKNQSLSMSYRTCTELVSKACRKLIKTDLVAATEVYLVVSIYTHKSISWKKSRISTKMGTPSVIYNWESSSHYVRTHTTVQSFSMSLQVITKYRKETSFHWRFENFSSTFHVISTRISTRSTSKR